jgi:hypothetical protein
MASRNPRRRKIVILQPNFTTAEFFITTRHDSMPCSLRPRYWIDTAARISQMKLLLSIAAIAHLLVVSQFSDAYAADPYDGEWTGSAKGTSDGRCKPADVTLTVHGKVVTGQAKFETDIANIYGTVREDGTFGATSGDACEELRMTNFECSSDRIR